MNEQFDNTIERWKLLKADPRTAGIPVVAVPFGYTDVPVEELEPDVVIQHFDALYDAVRRLDPGAA